MTFTFVTSPYTGGVLRAKLMAVTSNVPVQGPYKLEPPITMVDHPYGVPHNERAEKLNGRLAMLGVIAALGAYALTGQIIPGIW